MLHTITLKGIEMRMILINYGDYLSMHSIMPKPSEDNKVKFIESFNENIIKLEMEIAN